jgi:hypothetical protein
MSLRICVDASSGYKPSERPRQFALDEAVPLFDLCVCFFTFACGSRNRGLLARARSALSRKQGSGSSATKFLAPELRPSHPRTVQELNLIEMIGV